MFRCSQDRAEWYLSRKLATLEKASKTIRLTFQANGLGHKDDPFFTAEKDNVCCVCGTNSDLTKHHIVPYQYKKHFPEYTRSHGSYDVLPLCVNCHLACERQCARKNRELVERYGASKATPHSEPNRALSYCKVLINNSASLPEEVRNRFLDELQPLLGKVDPTFERIVALCDKLEKQEKHEKALNRRKAKKSSIGAQIVAKIENLDDFAIEWRKLFVETMRPQFLPDAWKIDRRVYAEAHARVKKNE